MAVMSKGWLYDDLKPNRISSRNKIMGRAENRSKAQARAAWLKVHSPVRTHFMCPWDCGHMVKVDGGQSLLTHLTVCKGNIRKDHHGPQTQVRRNAA